MKTIQKPRFLLKVIMVCFIIVGCGNVPVKKFYTINYEPEPLKNKKLSSPYPYTIRVKEFSIEQAYARPQIVYRKSPFELQYYFYRVWAIKPTRMITDIIHKHIASTELVSHVIRRFDEGIKPDYELSGTIEAIEEYDSEDVWFAHLAIRMKLTRLKDNHTVYMRRFDRRKRVFQYNPEYVISELSQIMDFIMSQALHDIDAALAKEYGVTSVPIPEETDIQTEGFDTLSSGDHIE